MHATVRTLARDLGISRATVSNALRGVGRVAPATKERVLTAALAAGYKHNPLAARVMSEMRRSRGTLFRGMLATLSVGDWHAEPQDSFIRTLTRAAQARAEELGFKMEAFATGPRDLSIKRLDSILQSRGINGLLILPSKVDPDLRALDWSRYAAIYTDRNPCAPTLHTLCSDHYNALLTTLTLLRTRGYRRPGLFLENIRDHRLAYRRCAALHAFQLTYPDTVVIPPLLVDKVAPESFKKWFRAHQPDVVLGHASETIDWMTSCGAKIPRTHGFVSLNTIYQDRPTAGIDQQPSEIGARAAEQLIAQLQRNELGIPTWPTTTTILARWTDGPTLAPPS